MRAQQIQQQLKFNADALTEMYKRYGELRRERNKFNGLADYFFDISENAASNEEHKERLKDAVKFKDQASIFTPEINKLRKRIASMEAIQKALKHELKCAACLEAWQKEDDAAWEGSAQEFLANVCNVPPEGWHCTREKGHEGPCAAWPVERG